MKNKFKNQVIFLLAASGMALSVQASDLSYNYVELGYRTISIDTDTSDDIFDIDNLVNDVDPAGIYLGASFELTEDFFLYGHYSNASGDAAGSFSGVGFDLDLSVDLDYSQYELGVGYKYPISNRTDFIATLAYLDVDSDVKGSGQITVGDEVDSFVETQSFGDDALAVGLGFRALVTDSLELNGQVQYLDFEESETALKIGGVYNFTGNHAATLGATFIDDQTDFTIGYRYSF